MIVVWRCKKKTEDLAKKRMQRFGMILERFISPEASFSLYLVVL